MAKKKEKKRWSGFSWDVPGVGINCFHSEFEAFPSKCLCAGDADDSLMVPEDAPVLILGDEPRECGCGRSMCRHAFYVPIFYRGMLLWA